MIAFTRALAIALSIATGSVAAGREGKTLAITLPDHTRLTLRPIHILSNTAQCGVRIGRQQLMTMGVGETEAYGCVGLVAAGTISADRGIPRIGLIYDVASPNAAFRTAVILRRDAGVWQVDKAYSGRFDDSPSGRSLPALRRALSVSRAGRKG